tara:strand:+ start:323 stop:538 length:216 start_codon:yes stop_codon:yes gene_type:complete
MTFKITYAIDSLDPNPTTKTFEQEWEAIDWLNDEISRRIEFIVSHSPYIVSEAELETITETEYSLCKIERI